MVKRLWVLSFVLAPYTHALSQMVHTPVAKKTVDRIMPQLVEHHHLHSHHNLSPAKARADPDHKQAEDSHNDPTIHGHLCAQCQVHSTCCSMVSYSASLHCQS